MPLIAIPKKELEEKKQKKKKNKKKITTKLLVKKKMNLRNTRSKWLCSSSAMTTQSEEF